MTLSVAIAFGTVWGAIALSYNTNYPVGFFVGMISAGCYLGRVAGAHRHRPVPTATSVPVISART